MLNLLTTERLREELEIVADQLEQYKVCDYDTVSNYAKNSFDLIEKLVDELDFLESCLVD